MRPLALVTGASRGIGLCLAQRLAADGYDLVLVARDEAALNKVALELAASGATAHVLIADLADPTAVRRLAEQLAVRKLTVDVLVNNAGFGTFGAFAQTAAEQSHEMLEVNVVALTLLTRALLPGMIARRRGGVLNVASAAAFQPGPHMAAYYASKAYVLSFSEALAVELRGSGVNVSVLCPGPTHSSFTAVAGVPDSSLFDKSRFEDPVAVAAAGVAGLQRGQVVVITGLMNRVRTFGLRFLPRSVVARMVERMQRPTLQLPAAAAR